MVLHVLYSFKEKGRKAWYQNLSRYFQYHGYNFQKEIKLFTVKGQCTKGCLNRI